MKKLTKQIEGIIVYTIQLKSLALLCSLALLACCGTKEKKSQSMTLADCPVIAELIDSVTVLDLASVKDTFNIPMSLLLSSFEVIQLENSDEALVNQTSAYVISENYVGLNSSGKYKLFDRKGKFLRDISVNGQGPSEFNIAIYDSYIDEINKRIYLLSFMANKILVFDLKGKAYPPIPLPFRIPKACFHINAEKEELVVTALTFKEVPYVVWKQDFKGNVLQSIDSKPFRIDYGDYANEVYSTQNTSAIDFQVSTWMLNRNDPLYHYNIEENTITPVLSIKWDRDIALHGHTELPNHYLTCLFIPASPTYVPRSPQILIEKETLRGCYANFKFNMLGNIDGPNYFKFNRGYLIGSMYPHEIKEQLENALAHPEKLTPQMKAKVKKLNDRITEDDNNIILLGKLRGSE
jgi:hypothetical protein